MSILKTLRTATAYPQPYPYVDTPDFAYAGSLEDGTPVGWLDGLLQNNDQPIGTVSGNPSVAIIGGGVSGLCAGYELMRAGCTVTVFEQASQVGGRCASHMFLDGDIAEMGSMRFPPSEFILDFYLKKLGILPGGLWQLEDFPDPGKQLTYVCYGNKVQTWIGPNPPEGFENVANGWNTFMSDGLYVESTNGQVLVLQPVSAIVSALTAGQIDTATQYWQEYIEAFGQTTFYSALNTIFTGSGPYIIPGGNPWTFEDFDKFGELGLGSGGFVPFYPIGFIEIFRIIVNGLETSQKFLKPSQTLRFGIRTLALALAELVGTAPSQVLTETPISTIARTANGFLLSGPTGRQFGPYARVIVATTTRAMEVSLNLTAPVSSALSTIVVKPLVSRDVAVAIMRTHVVSSNKVAARIEKFWTNDPGAVRCLQTDNLVHQVYTLDYSPHMLWPANTAVCFISYVWDDDAVKQQAITSGVPSGAADNKLIYDYLLRSLESIGGPVAGWAKKLKPLDGSYENNVVYEEWQSSPYFAGAFKLSEPGQDPYVQAMFFDYQKCTNPEADTGVYIAGDCIHWNSGWVEGGLTTGLNAAAGVIASLGGTLNANASNATPLSILATRFKYF